MKTTKQDFLNFQQYAKDWQEKLGLREWSLYFEHADVADVFAQTHYSTSDMLATIQLAKSWDDLRPKSNNELNSLALHEVLHILMAPLCAKAEERFAGRDSINTAEHSIVRRLENLLK